MHPFDCYPSGVLTFKTRVCEDWKDGKCSQGRDCLQTHDQKPLRRKPTCYHNGFNYQPRRCHLGPRCLGEEYCRFAHHDLEVMFHPLVYRTQLCPEVCTSNGTCSRYGHRCAKAHMLKDLRLVTQSKALLLFSPPPMTDVHIMAWYKTRQCTGFPFNCSCDDFDYHDVSERRRSPALVSYLATPCPYVKGRGDNWDDPQQKAGCVEIHDDKAEPWNCLYSHTRLEVMYHPDIYKTQLCAKRQHLCKWQSRCAHAHRIDDRRRAALLLPPKIRTPEAYNSHRRSSQAC